MNYGRKNSTTAPLTPHWEATMAELCELIGTYIRSLLESTLKKDLMGLHRDDGLVILRNTNSQQTDKSSYVFSSIDFKIEITTNLTEADFLDVTLI